MKKRLIIFGLKSVACLPLAILYLLSGFVYVVLYHMIGYRKKVVRKNLTEAFPERNCEEIRKIEREFYRYLADLVVETVKLISVSSEELRRRVKVYGSDEVTKSAGSGKSAVLLLAHYCNWEWVQQISESLDVDVYKASIYHPLKNPIWDDIFKKIRSRWCVHILPQSEAVRALLETSHRPWICGFIADHRPRTVTPDNHIEFLNHDTAFIYGPEMLGKKVGADYFFLKMERPKRGYYNITFERLNPREEIGHPYPHIRMFWKALEKEIQNNPAYWLWSHKRWKK